MARPHPALALLIAVIAAALLAPCAAVGQEAKRRWERLKQIRLDKFDLVLPQVMRENGVDMWDHDAAGGQLRHLARRLR